ncbi:hypothetical protein [uncultured Rhodoblastus sp.]|uniref:hypothetical protein n=1 Tax=uncultured Rhodoblastus sp. TaxID=543037 RepID=UPI0025F893A1|nr:hypothetical protein [uncultured Rhodoblastus sp.]
MKNLAKSMQLTEMSRQAQASNPASHPSTGGETALFETLLASGGDERLGHEPKTGRNGLGFSAGPEGSEIFLSSATATAVSPHGKAAALRAFELTMRAKERHGGKDGKSLPAWFDDIRRRLFDLFSPPGGEIALCASSAEAELILLAMAQKLLVRPLTNLVVASREADTGVALAADGRHFLGSAPFASQVSSGAALAGFPVAGRQLERFELRDRYGAPLEAAEIEGQVTAQVTVLVAAGRDVILHIADCSETGQSGPSRRAAAALARAFPENLLVVVDAGQLRCPRETLRADLDAGCIVLLSGSKFAGGPPFSGAVLVPPALAARLKDMVLPEGLADYSAALDWSPLLRENLRGNFSTLANIGLGLRWECALAELEAYFALDAALRERIAARFAQEVHSHLAASPQLKLADYDWRPNAHVRTIFPILTFDDRGAAISAEKLFRALRNPKTTQATPATARPGRRPKKWPEKWPRQSRLHFERSHGQRIIHLGEPVAIGQMQALRLCLCAAQVNDVARRLAGGEKFDYAFQPLADDLAETFGRWNDLATHDPSYLEKA